MSSNTSLSVVIPTFNCVDLIERHIDSVMSWADLAYEIIVVDSQSNDGTFELVKQKLHHPNLRFIQRERGLYESWNAAIKETRGDWIYISTAGDLIKRDHLVKLLQAGILSKANVVISPFRPVNENGQPYQGPGFQNAKIYNELYQRGDCVIEPLATYHFAFQNEKPNALLGSCASDLFHGDFLRSRPFLTQYGTHGDTAWTLRYSSEMRLCVISTNGSVFCVHSKEINESDSNRGNILEKIFQTELINARAKLISEKTGIKLDAHTRLKIRAREIHGQRRKLWNGKSEIKSNKLRWIYLTLHYICLKLYLFFHSSLLKFKMRKWIHPLNIN
jgi:glycosyltransferase involved in cell wall biosynthesis